MKKVIFISAIALVSALGTQTYAQTPTANAETGIRYEANVPTLSNPAQQKKVQALDKFFQDYQAAKLNNENAKAATVKKSIMKWMTDNNSWIEKLDAGERDAYHLWSEVALTTLKLTEVE
jgi:hypothetical protein